MNEEQKIEETEKAPTNSSESEKQPSDDVDREFNVTVRKLELPVRPRGVLADG
jgi:hypothetical protein